MAFSLAEARGRITQRVPHFNSPNTIKDNFIPRHSLSGYPGLQERRPELVTVRPLKPSVEPDREEIARTLRSVSPDLGQRLRNHWTTDLSSKYMGQIFRSVARLELVASHIDVSDVTVYYKSDRVRSPVSESDPDISGLKNWYRNLAILYVSQSLMGMENKSYTEVAEFVSDLQFNLQKPQGPDLVPSLDPDLAAAAHYVDFHPGGEKLAISASRDENDLTGVKFYEAEVHLTLPEMAREVIYKQNGRVVRDLDLLGIDFH